jgi:hypothetical protein
MTLFFRRRPAGVFSTPLRSTGQGLAVDVALVLAIDVSGSVSESRMLMQIEGYAHALRHPGFLDAVRGGPIGRIALTFVEWSEARRQTQAVGWRVIQDRKDANDFVEALLHAERPMPGWTSISAAIDYAAGLFEQSGVQPLRKVIDISSDGINNDGREVKAARDDAVTAGIIINGLPIVEVDPRLDDYYRENVIGGHGSFVIVAHDMGNFTDAILRKLLIEVAGAPPPAG